MKKKFLSLLILAMMGGSAMAGDKPVITVADVETLPGQTVSFAVNLVDGKADTYTAMTLYAYFPTTGFTTTSNYTISSVWKGASTTVGDITNTGLATIPFASSNKIPGSAVDNLVTVEFTVDASVSPGEYDVTLKGTMFEYNTSDKDYADDITFTVIVTDRVILDEESTTAPEAIADVNVKVKRTINANTWSTICLPFAMDENQVKAAFGDDVVLGDFKGYETKGESDEIASIEVKFDEVTSIEANHPYIIYVGSLVETFTVDGVTIDPEDDPRVSFGYNTGKKPVVYHPSDFVGTYVADFDFYNDAYSYPLFLSGNKFYYATDKKTKHLKAYRAYFDFDDYLPEAEPTMPARIYMSFGAETTKIDARTMETIETGKVYNIAGQYVGEGEDMNRLPKGIYIVNGKKVIK